MQHLQMHLAPQEINHFPVVAAVAPIKVKGTPVEREWVVVCHDRRDDTFVTWHVYAMRHAVTGGYLAEHGHYGLTYAQAVRDMMSRAGLASDDA